MSLKKSANLQEIDDLLDDEGWDLLNSLTEEELEQLNNDFDPEKSLMHVGSRDGNNNDEPMFNKEDLVDSLEKMVAKSQEPEIKNEKLRKKEDQKKKVKEAKLKKQYSRDKDDLLPPPPKQIALTEEEEQLLNEATEEELIEAAEKALREKQFELRGKLQYVLQERKQRQLNMLSFINDDVDSYDIITTTDVGKSAQHNDSKIGANEYDEQTEHSINQELHGNENEEEDQESRHSRRQSFELERQSRENVQPSYGDDDVTDHYSIGAADSETDTITEFITNHTELDFHTDTNVTSTVLSDYPHDETDCMTDSESSDSLKRVKQMKAHVLEKQRQSEASKLTPDCSMEIIEKYSLEKVRKYNQNVQKYNESIEKVNERKRKSRRTKSNHNQNIQRLPDEHNRKHVRKNDEASDCSDEYLSGSSSSLRSVKKRSLTTSKKKIENGCYTAIIPYTDNESSQDDMAPPLKVNLNVSINKGEKKLNSITPDDVKEEQTDKLKKIKARRKKEITVAVDIAVNIDRMSNAELKTTFNVPPALKRKDLELTFNVEGDDIVNKMTTDIARRRQQRDVLHYNSLNRSMTSVDDLSVFQNTEPRTSTPKRQQGNRFMKTLIEHEEIKDEKVDKPSHDNSRDTIEPVCLNTVRYTHTHSSQRNPPSYNTSTDILSDSGIDQTSSEMGFATPNRLERDCITPTELLDINNVPVLSPDGVYVLDRVQPRVNANPRGVVVTESRGESRLADIEDNDHRGNYDQKIQSIENKTSRLYSKARKNSSKLKISREKSIEKIKKLQKQFSKQNSFSNQKLVSRKLSRSESKPVSRINSSTNIACAHGNGSERKNGNRLNKQPSRNEEELCKPSLRAKSKYTRRNSSSDSPSKTSSSIMKIKRTTSNEIKNDTLKNSVLHEKLLKSNRFLLCEDDLKSVNARYNASKKVRVGRILDEVDNTSNEMSRQKSDKKYKHCLKSRYEEESGNLNTSRDFEINQSNNLHGPARLKPKDDYKTISSKLKYEKSCNIDESMAEQKKPRDIEDTMEPLFISRNSKMEHKFNIDATNSSATNLLSKLAKLNNSSRDNNNQLHSSHHHKKQSHNEFDEIKEGARRNEKQAYRQRKLSRDKSVDKLKSLHDAHKQTVTNRIFSTRCENDNFVSKLLYKDAIDLKRIENNVSTKSERRFDDDNVEKPIAYEEKFSAAQQIGLTNLKRLKEKAAKESKEKNENEDIKRKSKVEGIKTDVPVNVKEPISGSLQYLLKSPPAIRKISGSLQYLLKSPPAIRKKIVPETNTKEEGLKAVESIRSKLRKVPKPKWIEEDAEADDAAENVQDLIKDRSTAESEQTKPKKKSALAALLERDASKLGSHKFEDEKKTQQKIDVRGVSAAVLQQALLKMNGILTNDQINSVIAGEKPTGASIKSSTSVKATRVPSKQIVRPQDEETELDVVALMKHLKEDTDSLFYLCINNQPKLERKIMMEVITAVGNSSKMKHLSLAMTGLIDADVKLLSRSIRYNEQLETLNLESNIITQSGLEVLMKEVGRHPSLREIKISNQKQPFGGQGEALMADAIDRNENILKFGYSFKQPGPRNKADRAIIRHNENLRQRRRNGEENVYDLKAVCKTRDPSPQPWIKVKGRRLLGGLIETKVTEMGHMIDVDNDLGRESRGPKLRDQEAKPLDINQLLSARKSKLKGTKIADLEQQQEKKNKRIMQEMHDSTKPQKDVVEKEKEDYTMEKGKNVLKKNADVVQLKKNADVVQVNGHAESRERSNGFDGQNEKNLGFGDVGKTAPFSSLPDEKKRTVLGKKKKTGGEEEEKGNNFAATTEKKEKVQESKHVMQQVKGEEKPEEKSKVNRGSAVKIAGLPSDEPTISRRRRTKFEDEENDNLHLDAEPERVTEKLKEPNKKKINDSSMNITKLPNEPVVSRRKKNEDQQGEIIDPLSNVSKKVEKVTSAQEISKKRGNDDKIDPFKVLEERKKQEAKEKAETEARAKREKEEEKQKRLKDQRKKFADIEGRKKLFLSGGKKVVADFESAETVPRRGKKAHYKEEAETNEFSKQEPPVDKIEIKKEEVEKEKVKKEEKPTNHVPKKDEKEESKNKCSRLGGVKSAALSPVEDIKPIRRRKNFDDEVIEKPKKEERIKETGKQKEEPTLKDKLLKEDKKVASLPSSKEKNYLQRNKKEESEKINSTALVGKKKLNAVKVASKNITDLPPPDTDISSIRRRRKKEEDEESVDPVASIPENTVEEKKQINKKGEEKKKEEEEKKKEEEKEKKPVTKTIKKEEPTKLNETALAGNAKKIASLLPKDEGVTSIRRRGRKSEEEEKVDLFAHTKNGNKEEEEERRTGSRRERVTRKEDGNNDENERSVSRRSTRRRNEDEDDKSARSPIEKPQERGYTDEKTKFGDRRFDSNTTVEPPKEEAPKDDVIDIFAGRNDDDGPRLSLRERMARRGR